MPTRIDHAAKNHRHDVLGLLAEYLPGTNVAARYAWLYEQNPHGRALTVVAYDAETHLPVGLTSVFPRRLIVCGREVMGSIGGDAYVRPVARRRGVATAMHKALLNRMRNEGIEVMFGPPEPHNLRALEHAGSRIVTHVRRYVRPVVVHEVLRPMSSWGPGRNTRLDPIEDRDARIDAIFERACPSSMVVPVRDSAFYTWRFKKSPSSAQRAFVVMCENKPLGSCVLERKLGRMALVDLFAPAESYARCLHAALASSPTSSFVVQLNECGPFANEMRWVGLMPRERKPFQVLTANDRAPHLFDASRWYYTWGDGDVDEVL